MRTRSGGNEWLRRNSRFGRYRLASRAGEKDGSGRDEGGLKEHLDEDWNSSV